jgi:hypothetical protein
MNLRERTHEVARGVRGRTTVVESPQLSARRRQITHRLFPLSALALAGCVVATDAVVPSATAAFDQRLIGTWNEVNGSDRAVVTRGDSVTYAIDYTSNNKTGRFSARLGLLGKRHVLDIWPTPGSEEIPEPYAGLMISGHVLMAIDVNSDDVRLAPLDADSLAKALRDGIIKLPYERAKDQLVLHASTRELRAALAPYLARASALAEPTTYRRARDFSATVPTGPVGVPCFEAAAWREADQLFHRDPHWLGGDVASTVDLGGNRTLWLFGDSWVDPTGRGTRQGAKMVSNTVAVQTGANPALATVTFHWGTTPTGAPDALFPNRNGERLWFGNGVRVKDRLVLFLARIRSTNTGLGFESVGWTAFLVENPDDAPSRWRTRELATPRNPLGVDVGFAGMLAMEDHVYAFGSPANVSTHGIFAARWTAEEVRRGDLRHPEWWAGDRLGWVADSSSAPRRPLFEDGQSELSIHRDAATGRFLAVHSRGFGPADVVMRSAPSLTGPWSEARIVYHPPEYNRPSVMIYAAKAHPTLIGADLVLTYATNSFKFAEHLSDSLIYYPRFVRLSRCQ